jgi:D-alanine-D-alanine ligase
MATASRPAAAEQASASSPRRDNSNAPAPSRTLGPVSDLERHLPTEWWRTLFNSVYLRTDGDVVENQENTARDIDLVLAAVQPAEDDRILDLCCGQGRHSLELARRGYTDIIGIDRSRYLVRLARKRAKGEGLPVRYSEGDARKIRLPESSRDAVIVMGNSFGYFEREDDDEAVLRSILRVLRGGGTLLLDVVDGEWMAKNFEARSWEWIDQAHFVARERALAEDGRRIISREVVTNANRGIIADQFYAERLYTRDEIAGLLARSGFVDIHFHGTVRSDSTRGQDLGMMAHRMVLTARAPQKAHVAAVAAKTQSVTVLLGDPRLPDPVKRNGTFNQEDMDTINRLKEALEGLDGFRFSYIDHHKQLMRKLLDAPPAFVCNLCDEGYRNDATLELHVPALLELLEIPYTGSGPACLALCYDKALVRACAMSLDIPVPEETMFAPGDQAGHLPGDFPALLKPSLGDSSIGITQYAVVHNAGELVAYLDYLAGTLPGVPVLIQEFLSGREFSVGLVGNPGKFEALPILEVDYSKLPESLPKLLSYESKWHPESPYWTEISYKEAELDDDTNRALVQNSERLFQALGCRDYARFDFRMDSRGVAKLLEVNPNPGWCWDGKFNLMASMGGIGYPELLRKIVDAARERYPNLAA